MGRDGWGQVGAWQQCFILEIPSEHQCQVALGFPACPVLGGLPSPCSTCPWFCLPTLGKGLPSCPGARQGSSCASSPVPAGWSPAHVAPGAPAGLSICSMAPSFLSHGHHCPGQALGFLPQQGRSWADRGAGGAAGLGFPVQQGQAQLGTERGTGASGHSSRAQH